MGSRAIYTNRRSDGARLYLDYQADTLPDRKAATLRQLAKHRAYDWEAFHVSHAYLPRNERYCANCDFHESEHIGGRCLLSIERFIGYQFK